MVVEAFRSKRENLNIVGRLAIPDGDGPFPVLIFSHGYGYNLKLLDLEKFARNGIAACDFDFCGGSLASRSDGVSTEMSVLTEADDLDAVIESLKINPRINVNCIMLAGHSQGGYVSSIVAMRRKQEIKQLFLLAPAYLLVDFPGYSLFFGGLAPTFKMFNMMLGRKYVKAIKEFPVYEHMKDYVNPVIIYHGTADNMAPIEYSVRAQKKYPHAILNQIPGADHDLAGHLEEIQNDMILKIKELYIIPDID